MSQLKRKREIRRFAQKLGLVGGQDAQNEICARLSKSNPNENLDNFACKNQRAGKVGCLFGFLMFFGLLLNFQNNLFAGGTHTVENSGSYYYDTQEDVQCLKYSISGGDVILEGCESIPASGKITIPNYISHNYIDYPVTKVSDWAFASNPNLKIVDASGCTNLSKLNIWLFYNCTALTIADFSGCTSLQIIDSGAFLFCNNLIKVDFSGCIKLKTLYGGAFGGCEKAEVIFEPGAFSATDSSIATDALSGVKRVTILGGGNDLISNTVSSNGLSNHKKVTFEQLSVNGEGNLTSKPVMVQYVKSSSGNYVKDPSKPAYTYTNAAGTTVTRKYQYTDNGTKKDYGSFWRLPNSAAAFVFGGDDGGGAAVTTDITLIDQRAVVFDANGGTFNTLGNPPYVTTSDYNFFNSDMTKYTTLACQNGSSYVIFRPLGNDVVSRADYDCLGYAATNNAAAALDDAGMISHVTTAFSSESPPAAVTFYVIWDPFEYTVIQIVNEVEKENYGLLPDGSVMVGDSEDVPGLLYWQVVDADGNPVTGVSTIAGGTTIAYSDLATNGCYHDYIVNITEDDGEQPILIRCLKLVAVLKPYKIVEFKLQKTFASGGSQFFAAIGNAASEQSPQQSITEFLKSNVVANMFDVKRAANSSVKEGEETLLLAKKTELAAGSDDLNSYVIKSVDIEGTKSFTVTFNVVVPVGDTLGVIRLRENEKCINGLFTVTYSNCDLSYANLTEPSSSAS